MKNNSADATHTNKDGKHLYRIASGKSKNSLLFSVRYPWTLGIVMEFWDENCNVWRPSIMRKSELKEIKTI